VDPEPPQARPDAGQHTSEKLTVAAPKIAGVATMVSSAAPTLRYPPDERVQTLAPDVIDPSFPLKGRVYQSSSLQELQMLDYRSP